MRLRFLSRVLVLPLCVASLAMAQSATAAIFNWAGPLTPVCQDQEVEVPDTPAGKRFSEFLEVIKTGDANQTLEFSKRAFVDDAEQAVSRRAGQFGAAKSLVGDGKVLRVQNSDDHEVVIVVAVADGEATFTVTVEPDEPHRIASLSIAARPAGEAAADNSPLSDEELQAIITESAEQLEQKYVFPEVGDKMAAHLRESLEAGRYDDLTDPAKLGQQVTEELRDICHDRHLGLRPAAPPQRRGPGSLMRRSTNHGFLKTEILPGNIGYIKFNAFEPSEEALRVAAAAMEFVREADAVIFDVRENGGGSPRMIVCLTSYLFDKPTHLNSFYNRITDETTETWTTENEPAWRFPADTPVYVLTSSYTFSAAEEFTYNLQCLKRATIVGETTGGGAHPVRGEFVGGRMQLRVPYARAINPITNTNWEGVGIKPDVESSAPDALDAAVEHAKAAIAEKSGD